MRGVFVFMATYSLLITTPPHNGDATARVLQFIEEIYENRDTVANIFFFQDGVYHANRFIPNISGELNPLREWQNIHNTRKVKLIVCNTAANKRGILDTEEAHNAGMDVSIIAPEFSQSGLGEFFADLHECDHLVQF